MPMPMIINYHQINHVEDEAEKKRAIGNVTEATIKAYPSQAFSPPDA